MEEIKHDFTRFYLPKVFEVPSDYSYLPNDQLESDTSRPESNSRNYRYKSSLYKTPDDYRSFYTNIVQNEEGLFILASNEFTTTVFDSVVGASENFDDFSSSNLDSAKFMSTSQSTVTNINFLKNGSMFIQATSNNTVELYNYKEPIEGKIIKNIARRIVDGGMNCMTELVSDNNRIVVGTKNGGIEAFDCFERDLSPVFSYPDAHKSLVYGVSAHPQQHNCWMSCSSNVCYLWDKRMVFPMTALLLKDQSMDKMNGVYWYKNHIVMITDINGDIMVLDIRKSKEIIFQTTLNRSIDSLIFDKDNIGVILRNRKVKVFTINDKHEPEPIHEHTSPHIIYSMCFDKKEKDDLTYYVVGEKKYATKVEFKRSNSGK